MHLARQEAGSSSFLYVSFLPQESECEDSEAPSSAFLPPHSQPGIQSPGTQPLTTMPFQRHATATVAGACRPLRQ